MPGRRGAGGAARHIFAPSAPHVAHTCTDVVKAVRPYFAVKPYCPPPPPLPFDSPSFYIITIKITQCFQDSSDPETRGAEKLSHTKHRRSKGAVSPVGAVPVGARVLVGATAIPNSRTQDRAGGGVAWLAWLAH